MKTKIWLSSPHMGGNEQKYINEVIFYINKNEYEVKWMYCKGSTENVVFKRQHGR